MAIFNQEGQTVVTQVNVSNADFKRKVTEAIQDFNWPNDGTYEDMYFSLVREVDTLFETLLRVLREG